MEVLLHSVTSILDTGSRLQARSAILTEKWPTGGNRTLGGSQIGSRRSGEEINCVCVCVRACDTSVVSRVWDCGICSCEQFSKTVTEKLAARVCYVGLIKDRGVRGGAVG